MDDFDIDKFLNESFAKIEKKFDKKTKKVDKVLPKYADKVASNFVSEKREDGKMDMNNVPSNKTLPEFNINNYNFEKVIDNRIFQEINLSNLTSKNTQVNLENVIKPLFPNEKVFESEFKNSDRNFILDRFVGNPSNKVENEKNILTGTNIQALKINKYKKIKESELISQLKQDPSIKYSSLLPIHSLWNEYIANLLNKSTQPDTIYNKMLKADLHGAIIEVIDSKNKNQVGIKGINLLETRRTFNLLTEGDKVKTILKKGTVFKVNLPYEEAKYSVKIIGDNFTYKAVERTKAKYKIKYNLK